MRFKLPKLHELVNKSNKLTKEDISQYIFIHNGIAITFLDNVKGIVNLREYVINECELEFDYDFEHLDSILKYLEGKAIPADAWKQLTSFCEVEFLEDEEEIRIINDRHSLILELKDNNIDYSYFKKNIKITKDLLSSKDVALESNAYHYSVLNMILKAFGNELKSDILLIRNSEHQNIVKCQFRSRSDIYILASVDVYTNSEFKGFTADANIDEITELLISNKEF